MHTRTLSINEIVLLMKNEVSSQIKEPVEEQQLPVEKPKHSSFLFCKHYTFLLCSMNCYD